MLPKALINSLLIVGLIGGGCTHRQLAKSTSMTAGSVMETEYRIVLMNLALFSCHPDALPCHVRIKDGVVQINDEVGWGSAGGFTMFNGTDFGIDQFGPAASRQVTEQWGTDAVSDPVDLKTLQDMYRVAMGLAPLPDSHAIQYIKQQPESVDSSGSGSDSDSPSLASRDQASRIVQIRVTSSDNSETDGESGSSSSESGSKSDSIPLEILLRDVPEPGWFCIGSRKEVPKNAAYVSRYGNRYAWVMPEGVPYLAQLTLAILVVTKLEAGEAMSSSGLAFTR